MAECFELADVVAFAAFGPDSVVVELRVEVVVSAGGVGEQVPDDDQNGPSDCDLGFLLADASDVAPVACAEEGVGAAEAAASPRTLLR